MFEAARTAYADAGIDASQRDRLVRVRVRGLRRGHEHLRRVRAGSARRGPATGPDRGVRRAVRDRDRRDADPIGDRQDRCGRGAFESVGRGLARPDRALRARSGAQPAAGRSGARRRRVGDAPVPARERPDRGGMRGRRDPEPRARRGEPARGVRGCRRPHRAVRSADERAGRAEHRRLRGDGAGRRGSRAPRRGLGRRRRLEPGRAQPGEPALGRGRGGAARGRDGVSPGGGRPGRRGRRGGRRHVRVQAVAAPRRARPAGARSLAR